MGSPEPDAGSVVGWSWFGVSGCRSRSGVPDLVLVGGPVPGVAAWEWGCGLGYPKVCAKWIGPSYWVRGPERLVAAISLLLADQSPGISWPSVPPLGDGGISTMRS